MIRQRVSLAVAGAFVASSAFTLGVVSPANAAPTIYDPKFTPAAGDLSGAGSDTTEIALNYLTEGHNGIDGFNVDKATGLLKTTGRVASFAAGLDPAKVVLKSGAAPIDRPNGSGAGKALLYGPNNTAGNTDLDFARSSSGLKPAEISAGLQQAAFAVDGLKLAVSQSSNAPATITDAQLVKIYDGTYKNWSEIGGTAGLIKPLIPQDGSGTRSFFTDQLKAKNGGNAVSLASTVTSTQEHSDVDIKNDPNAIAPFSTGRAKSTPSVKTLGGFSAQRALYNVVRGADLIGSKGALIEAALGKTGFVCSPAAKPLIEAAGFEQLATPTAPIPGVCGTFSQADAASPFVTTNSVAQTTSTTLSAVAQNGKSVKLTAAVNASAGLPSGKVVFREGDAQVGTAQVISGSATLTLPNVSLGKHTYTATYNPTNAAAFTTSSAPASTATVLKTSGISVAPVAKTFGAAASIPVRVSSDGVPAAGSITVNAGGSVSTLALSNGAASVAVPATLAAGSYAVSVAYNSDGATSSSVASSTLSVSKAKTISTLKLSKSKVKASKKAKATITVKISGSSLKASGKVTLKAGSKTVGTGTVKNGKVTVTLKKLKKGAYKIKATFAGTGNYGKSVTKTVKLKVTK